MTKLSLAGKELTVPAYYEGQKTSGAPDHYESLDEARRLRSTGKATSINRGKAILIRGPRRLSDTTRNSVKRAWKVVGQTQRGAIKPGFPHWSSVK
jgi:hypothetical protein